MSHLTTLPVSTVFTEQDLQDAFPFPSFNAMQCQLLSPVLMNDGSIVVSAPTSSGKTVIFEFAVMKLIRDMRKEGSFDC